MSGHSKWHKVRQFKGAIDAKRSASFTKLAREITVAAREKGSDPEFNVQLRVAIDRAKKSSMPKDNIERAIKKGTGEGGAEGQLIEPMYEAYGPNGSALIIECLTDNRNRSVAEVKTILSKNGGTFANAGAVAHLFDRRGVIRSEQKLPSDQHDEIELALIDAGALDIQESEDGLEIQAEPTDFAKITEAVEKAGIPISSAGFEWIPKMPIDVDETTGIAVEDLIDLLEENDDVSRVFSNLA